MDFIFDPSLVLYLPLYELDGASFMSKDACGHLCTVTGAVWRPNGRYFDGSDDKIVVPDCAVLSAMPAITAEVWMKSDGDAGALNGLIGKYGPAGEIEWFTKLDDDAPEIGMRIYDASVNKRIGRMDTTSNVWDDVWHHIVFVWDGTALSSGIKIYVDTAQTDDTDDEAAGFVAIEDKTANVQVGTRTTDIGYFKGTIGEVRLYRRALTPLEIQHNYLATKWRYR
ncbi:MAG: LamG domain-containing protein [Dehalococcoidales bacterium]